MSFLAPLFALGFLGVAAPVVFHLIRRRPKGEVLFGSLMFLSPTPPRPTRRSRLDQLLLLLLRASALGLIGLAFMRPFVGDEAAADAGDGSQRRVAVLIDTSASLRRGDLWQRALAEADAALADCRPTDQVALFAFDNAPRVVLGFKESSELDPSRRVVVARERAKQLAPTWGGTELGVALADAVAAVTEAAAASGPGPARIVLVSDLPQGVRLTGLGEAEWPAGVVLELRTVTDGGGNAGLERLADPRAEEPKAGDAGQLRVRVVNDAASRQEQFTVSWVGPDGKAAGTGVEVYVPPGEGRVVRVPRPTDATPRQALRLTGDGHPFDNTVYVPVPRREELTVLYLGADDATDPTGARYFLERTWGDTPERTVRVLGRRPDEPLAWDEVRLLPLVVATAETTPANAALLRRYVQDGGTLLFVAGPGKADTLAAFADVPTWDVEDARVERYAMLRDVSFDHPLFAPLAGPQFGDFTKIHFWKHRKIDADRLGGWVLARFDDGDPAVLEKAVGRGQLVVFASGWQPADGQLARSSKFVPLMTALLDRRGGRRAEFPSYRVGDKVPLPSAAASAGARTVRKPDGATAAVPAEAATFDGTDLPGVYAVESAAGPWSFAVNLDPNESLTSPLPVETLERMGCRLSRSAEAAPDAAQRRQLRGAELESRQSLWRWLVLAALAVLLIETVLSGRRSRPRADAPEAETP